MEKITKECPYCSREILENNVGRSENLYAPGNFLVRGSDGETKTIPVSKFSGGTIYIADPMAVESLKEYLNNDEFDLLLDFEKYLERHKTKAH